MKSLAQGCIGSGWSLDFHARVFLEAGCRVGDSQVTVHPPEGHGPAFDYPPGVEEEGCAGGALLPGPVGW